ncbi:MAG TPA: hypothetical protein G4O08_01870 [Anaerolineae bacterium]|nr:hypothetical protein [Anaerolineae bacterium]
MRKAFLPTILAFFIVAAFVITILATHAWDPMAFVLERPGDVPDDQTWGIGYDGQQAYAIAVDPLGASSKLDHPAYRYQRILYPMLARILVLGVEDLIPWSLLVVNMLAACAGVFFVSQLLIERGVSVWWALVPLLSFNYLISMRLDLNEPLAYALALGGLWAFERKRMGWALVAFGLAGLAREAALVFPIGLVLWLWLKRRWRSGAAILAASALPYVGWALWVSRWLGKSPFATTLAKPLVIPFAGLFVMEGVEGRVMVGIWAVLPALIGGAAGLVHLMRNRSALESPEGLLVLTNAALIAILPSPTWVDALAVLRLGVGLMIALLLWLARARPSWLLFTAGLWGPSLLLLFMIPGFIR